jgi:hypothetical protein
VIVLSHPPQQVIRQGQTVIVRGVAEVARGARVELESRPAYGKPTPGWQVLVVAVPPRSGRFLLRWRVPAHEQTGPVSLRVVAERRGRIVQATRATSSWVGPAPVYCAPPTPPASVPPGDGWIVGGLYIEGGPAPGLDECYSASYTVTATDQQDMVAGSEDVAGGHSYTLVLPAGSYALRAGCSVQAQATVTAGQQTMANTACLVP